MTTPANTPTPRTDALAKRAGFGVGVEGYIDAVYADFARLLERENQQLQREKENQRLAKEGAVKIAEGLLKERNHFKQLAEERWKMCEELAEALDMFNLENETWHLRNPDYAHAEFEVTRLMGDTMRSALSRFHSLQQPKKDE